VVLAEKRPTRCLKTLVTPKVTEIFFPREGFFWRLSYGIANLQRMFLEKKTPGIRSPKDPDSHPFTAPEGYWVKCPECGSILQKTALLDNQEVCTECTHHFRCSAHRRIEILVDPGSFVETDKNIESTDVLSFVDSKPYPQRLVAAQKKHSLKDAFVSGSAKISSIPVEIGSFEFFFMGGSMGMVVGEKVARLFERALKKKKPAIIFQSSGGARMQEGILSLMQMAKTAAVLEKFKAKAQQPYISILTDPTTGGVAASFAMLGDFHLAEPKALVGFAGPRVIQQTINQHLPEGFQRAEFLLEHGMIDQIIDRREMRSEISKILMYFKAK
jgi:acetyl-CoA carboxylase carboxyl transferase subunit beta